MLQLLGFYILTIVMSLVTYCILCTKGPSICQFLLDAELFHGNQGSVSQYPMKHWGLSGLGLKCVLLDNNASQFPLKTNPSM